MDIALLVGLSLLLVIALGAIAFMYSYYIYTKNRLFTKIKFPILAVVILSLLTICLLILIILIGINFKSKQLSNKYIPAYLGLSIVLLILTIGYLTSFVLIYVFNNKNKIEYTDIANINWKQKIKDLEQKYGDMEDIKAKLSAKNPKYYTSMLEYYKTIVSRMGQKNLPISETIADIVTFNDAFTHKWCGFLNVYQLLLTYKFCAVFEKNPGQKNFFM